MGPEHGLILWEECHGAEDEFEEPQDNTCRWRLGIDELAHFAHKEGEEDVCKGARNIRVG